ncbi:MAG: hypothetical protein ACFFDF_12360 [Candidatus Odinarchaeota archaeon]
MMRDTVQLIESGGTIGFTIQPTILSELNLNVKNPVTIELFDETGEKSVAVFTRPLKKMGEGSLGVTIRYYLVKELKLNPKDIKQVDIRRAE